MVGEVEKSVEVLDRGANFILISDPVFFIVFERVDYIPSYCIGGGGVEESSAIIPSHEPIDCRFKSPKLTFKPKDTTVIS